MNTLPPLASIVSRLRLKHLQLLIALDDCGTVLKAAEVVSISQPGATKAIQEMESTLGTLLFLRTKRGLAPTDVGRCVIRYARLIQTDLKHLREEMADILQGHGGRLSIGVIMGAVPLLTEVLSAMLEKQAELSIELVEDTSERLLKLLDQGRLDLAICRTSISQHPELYNAQVIQDETLAVVANRRHPLAATQTVQLSELARYRWVVYSANMPMRLLLEREFHDAGLQFLVKPVATTSAFATLSMLQKNPTMVALVSTDVAEFCTSFGIVCILPMQLKSQSESYFLVSRRDRKLTPVAQLFTEELGLAPASDLQAL